MAQPLTTFTTPVPLRGLEADWDFWVVKDAPAPRSITLESSVKAICRNGLFPLLQLHKLTVVI
jgi:hypothetical protein